MRIEIAGALAVGKSTLCAKLAKRGFHIVSEDLSANPYLDLRVIDPERYGLLAQQKFVEDKVGAIVEAAAAGHPHVAVDFSLAAEMAYIDFYVGDRPDWVERLDAQISEGISSVGRPDAIVYLTCPAEEQLARIKFRGRGFEQGHDLDFVKAINSLVDDRISQAAAEGARVIKVDSRTMTAESDLLPPEIAVLLPTAVLGLAPAA